MTRIFIIAGEPSGDFLGARLVSAIRSVSPGCELTGVGGPQMKNAGILSLFPYEDLAVMGVAEVLPKLPLLIRRIQETARHIESVKPDIVVTIDSPDFSFRVMKAVRKSMPQAPKMVHYVAPTVWAWREGRAEKVSRFLDGLICLFDFEPPYFEKHGLRTVCAGHPLVEGAAMTANASSFREEYGVINERIVGVLFGSRRGELRRTAPILRDAAFTLCERIGGLPHIVAPTLPHLYGEVMELLREYPGAIHITTDPEHKWDAFKAMDVALAVSGTVGLELAAMQVPHVIAYKANPVTAAIVRKLIKVKHAHLANIMADAEIVPEFLQENAREEVIAAKALDLFLNPQGQIAAMADIASRLGARQAQKPSEKAAEFVLSFAPGA